MYRRSSWRFTFELLFTHQRETNLISYCLLCSTNHTLSCRLRLKALTWFILQWCLLHDLHRNPTLAEWVLPLRYHRRLGGSCREDGCQPTKPEQSICFDSRGFFHSAEFSVSPHLVLTCAVQACILACTRWQSVSLIPSPTHTHAAVSPKAVVVGCSCAWN